MSDSVRPHRRQPTRLPRPWDSTGKNTGVGLHTGELSSFVLKETPREGVTQSPRVVLGGGKQEAAGCFENPPPELGGL